MSSLSRNATKILGANGLPINGTLKDDGTTLSLDIAIQDQHTEIVDFYMHSHANEGLLLNADIDIDDNVFALDPGHGAIIGSIIGIKENGRMFQSEVINVVVNDITVASPSDQAFTSAAAEVHIGSKAMNVNGSVTTQIFKVTPPAGAIWDVTRIIFYIQSDSAMDDSRFGNIAAGLTNGVVIRADNGFVKNIFHVHTNGEFALRTFDTAYTDKAPAGSFGLRIRRTFAGPSKNGVTIRLNGDNGDSLQILVQDNLSTLEQFNCILQGHVVE